MKRAAAIGVVLFIANGAGAQTYPACLCDLNGDTKVGINELVIGVNNALTGCEGSGDSCPIDFADDNYRSGAPYCQYVGYWNDNCHDVGDNLMVLWRSRREKVGNILRIRLYTPEYLFLYELYAQVTSPTSADLLGWSQDPEDPLDFTRLGGAVFLNESGRRLTIAPDFEPFLIGLCGFARYEGALTGVFETADLRIGASPSIDPAAFERLRAALGPGAARPNFDRK